MIFTVDGFWQGGREGLSFLYRAGLWKFDSAPRSIWVTQIGLGGFGDWGTRVGG